MQRYEDRARANGRKRTDGDPSSWKLVGEVGGRLLQLAQSEVELASVELASDMKAARRTAVGLAVAVVAAIIGVTLLLVAVVLALVPFMPGWLAALLVAGLVFGVATTAGFIGWAQRPRSALARTRRSLKADWQWLKDQVA
jgi:uncharacterized membrane protein YqjE